MIPSSSDAKALALHVRWSLPDLVVVAMHNQRLLTDRLLRERAHKLLAE